MGDQSTFAPTWGNDRVYSQDNNHWENRFASSYDLQPKPKPTSQTRIQEEADLNFKERVLSMLEARSTNEAKLVKLLGILGESIQAIKADNAQMREEHATRIDSLEQTKMHNEQIIEEQTKRIEELEASVAQLVLYCARHEVQHQRQLGKNECFDVSINYLKDNWKRIDCFMCRNFREPWLKHIEGVIYSSDDEASWDVLPVHTYDEEEPSQIVNVSHPIQHELNEGQGNTSKKPLTATIDTWEGDEILRDLFEDWMHMDTPLAMNEFTDEPSCGSCGLHCVPQLKACVNMIQVKPEIKKVKEKEIQDLRRTIKRKLQRQWVPRCMFDIKEQFKSNTINFEDKCAKSYMPRWKKRKQRAPIICDSCD